jgi:hypothetical protein
VFVPYQFSVVNIPTFRISPFGDLTAASPNSIIFARDRSETFDKVSQLGKVPLPNIPGLPDFSCTIEKSGPVQTAGHPLIECGCRENQNSSLLCRHFPRIKDEKSPVLAKKIQKNSAAMFSIRYWSVD